MKEKEVKRILDDFIDSKCSELENENKDNECIGQNWGGYTTIDGLKYDITLDVIWEKSRYYYATIKVDNWVFDFDDNY